MGVPLGKLVSALGIDPLSVPNMDILGITSDSRQVQFGYLFVAIPGTVQDGHDFITEAINRGAQAVVIEKPTSNYSCPLITVSDSRKALAKLAACFWDQPSRKMKLVGITGTNGKTTTAYMLSHIFRIAARSAGLISTLEVKCQTHTFPSKLTTPVADTLQQYLALMVDEGLEFAVMEVSSQGINTHRIAELHFDLGILTNITLDHLDTHANFLEYREAKNRFINMLAPDGTVLLNADDLGARSLLTKLRTPYFTYGLGPFAQVQANAVQLMSQNSSFLLTISRPLSTNGKIIQPLELPLVVNVPGRHNIANALAAAITALFYGIDPIAIQQALATFPGVSRRLQLHRLGEFIVVDDTALNPASFDAVFECVATLPYRRLLVTYALRGNRSPAVNRANALTLAWWAKRLRFHDFLTTCSHECVCEQDLVSSEEEAAFFDALTAAGIFPAHFPKLQPALKTVLDRIGPGDLLLLLGAQGMDYGWELLQRLFLKSEGLAADYSQHWDALPSLT